MTMKLRDFRFEDADEVSRLARASWEHTYRDIFPQSLIDDFMSRFYSPAALQKALPAVQRGEAQFTVAVNAARELVGFCHIGRDKEGGFELYRIYLRPNVIGQGVGRLLLERSESFLSGLGVDRYHCNVHRLNELGKRFYERSGFVRHPEKDSEDHWYLEKVLSNDASRRALA
jgi:GNAT superfamily N-acetyltransferase